MQCDEGQTEKKCLVVVVVEVVRRDKAKEMGQRLTLILLDRSNSVDRSV